MTEHARYGTDRRPRHIRSFVRRDGRLTPAQHRALGTLWPRYGCDPASGPIDPLDFFDRHAPLLLDIGFGNGESLVYFANTHPEHNCLGVEVYRPGIGVLLQRLKERELANVRILNEDVATLLPRLRENVLDRVHIFFPDPWPKKRHHKRRLIQPPLVAQLARCMRQDGMLHIATDWDAYADHVSWVMAQSSAFRAAPEREGGRARTKYERRGESLGHQARDLVYVRTRVI